MHIMSLIPAHSVYLITLEYNTQYNYVVNPKTTGTMTLVGSDSTLIYLGKDEKNGVTF